MGFKTKIVYEGGKTEIPEGLLETPGIEAIEITQGAGVTTDGDLLVLRTLKEDSIEANIQIDSKVFTKFKPYQDKQNYPHFWKDDTQMQIMELLPEDSEDGQNLLGSIVGDLSGLSIILYLESYSNEENTMSGCRL